jgi:hypothetical protein
MRRKAVFITSDTTEDKFDDIERTLQRMSRKLFKTTTVIMPPIPISVALSKIPEDGEIFRGLFRVSGSISEIFAVCEDVTKDTRPLIKITVKQIDNIETSTSIVLKKGAASASPNFPIPAGSRVIMSVDNPSNVSNLWLSALYDMDILSAAKEALSIDDLVANMDKIVDDITVK